MYVFVRLCGSGAVCAAGRRVVIGATRAGQLDVFAVHVAAFAVYGHCIPHVAFIRYGNGRAARNHAE